jgi:hypothetical protein
MTQTKTRYQTKLEAFLEKGPFVQVDYGMFVEKNNQLVWQPGSWSQPDVPFDVMPPCAVCGSNRGAWRVVLEDPQGNLHYVAYRCAQRVAYERK